LRRELRQQDLADSAGVSHATVSLLERGRLGAMSVRTVRLVAAAVDVHVEMTGRWRGGDADRLLNRRHSLLANRVAALLRTEPGWAVEPEVSFSVYGERGVIDQLGWHAGTSHLLVIELKTEFVDINEMLGTLDRKIRLARTVAAGRGWRPLCVSAWVIVSDSRTNRRHAAQHSALLRSRLRLDGRQLQSFLRNPLEATTGLAFLTDASGTNTGSELGQNMTRVRPRQTRQPRTEAAAVRRTSAAGGPEGRGEGSAVRP